MKSSSYRNTIAEREAEWIWKLYGLTKPDELIWNTGTLDQLYGMVKLLDNKYEF